MQEHFSSITILIPDIKQGDHEAWCALCSKFEVALTNKSRRLILQNGKQNKISASDVVQETLLKAYRSRHHFRGSTTGELAGWLIVILKNTVVDWCKLSRSNEQALPSWFEFEQNQDTPSQIVVAAEVEASLMAAIAELDTTSQEVIMTRHFEGLRFQQIAEELELNINTVASIYRRGVKKLIELTQTSC